MLNPSTHSVILAKCELRGRMEEKRKIAYHNNPEASHHLRNLILEAIAFPPQSIVASYYARGSEMDPAPLAEALIERGHVIALPIMMGKKAPLQFRRYVPGDALELARFGVYQPLPDAPILEPDIVLVPLLAFDKNKGRLGYGGGYYDRTLTQLRQRKSILALGLGFSCQEVLEIPMGCHDARLDKIATEVNIF